MKKSSQVLRKSQALRSAKRARKSERSELQRGRAATERATKQRGKKFKGLLESLGVD